MENGAPERDKPQMENNEKPGEPDPAMHNTSPYVRTVVYLHSFRDSAKDTVESWKERGLADRLHDGWNNTRSKVSSKARNLFTHPENAPCKYIPQKYGYVFRPKSRWELVLLSGTVCGIEFCYAAETAFVTPILLSLGLGIKFVTMMWCLSPLIGLLLTPILGSMSDTCKSKLGRRRPFIIMYSIGILLGLILVPNGHRIGLALGDRSHQQREINQNIVVMLNGTSFNEVIMTQGGNLEDKLVSNLSEAFSESDKKDILLSLTSQDTSSQLQTDLKSTLRSAEQRHQSLDMEDVLPNLRFRSSESKLVTKSDEEENQEDEFSRLIDLELDDNKTEEDKTENPTAHASKVLNKAAFSNRKPDEVDVFPLKSHLKDKGISKSDFQNSQTTSRPKSVETFSNNNNIPEDLPSKSRHFQSTGETAKRTLDEEDIFISSMSDKTRFAERIKLKDTTNENIENESKSDSSVIFQDSDDEFSQLINMEDIPSSEEPNTNLGTETKSPDNLRKSPRANDFQDTFPARRINGNVQGSRDLLKFQKGISENSENSDSGKRTETDQKELKESITTKEQNNPPSLEDNSHSSYIQPWSIVFTVIGTVLLDFCSDACQSPSRTYLLDVSMPSDHAAGLSTFTVMAGLGGSIGYMMGAVHWETTFLGRLLGGQVNAVFLIVTIIFIICLLSTVCSFPEIPLSVFENPKMYNEYQEKIQNESGEEAGNEMTVINVRPTRYGSINEIVVRTSISKDDLADETNFNHIESEVHSTEKEPKAAKNSVSEPNQSQRKYSESKECQKVELCVPDQLESCKEQPTLKDFLRSIVQMPSSLRILCLTNLFCWMSLVCYSLYFTDFVGECVFEGDPQAPENSPSFLRYHEGVQFGCWGMALYSISCSIYSFFIESLIKKIGAKRAYVGGQLVYSCGMVIMALARHKIAVILLSPTAGVMYSTLFTMPYLLIAHYHSTKQFSDDQKGADVKVRGIGTDVAAVSSMVFLSQFVLSLSMGSIVEAIGSNVVPVCAAALLSACGALSATQVTYLDI